jgi:hypothetical protein
MLAEPSYDLVLDHLRAIRGGIDGLREDLREVKGRLTAVELGLASVRREIAALAEADAHLSARKIDFPTAWSASSVGRN